MVRRIFAGRLPRGPGRARRPRREPPSWHRPSMTVGSSRATFRPRRGPDRIPLRAVARELVREFNNFDRTSGGASMLSERGQCCKPFDWHSIQASDQIESDRDQLEDADRVETHPDNVAIVRGSPRYFSGLSGFRKRLFPDRDSLHRRVLSESSTASGIWHYPSPGRL